MLARPQRVALAGLAAFLLFAPSAGATLTSTESALLREMNRVRAARGLQPLRVNSGLERAARIYTQTLLAENVFTHGNFAARIRSYSIPGTYAGENLAWGVGSRATARGVVAGWLASPGHRANLLRPGFRYVGIGARTGTFAGHRGATLVTADFSGS